MQYIKEIKVNENQILFIEYLENGATLLVEVIEKDEEGQFSYVVEEQQIHLKTIKVEDNS